MRLIAIAAVLLLVPGCFTSGPLSDKFSHPGDASRDLASAKAYPKLLVEIDSPPGYGPDAAALDVYRDNLVRATGRAGNAISFDISDTSIPVEATRVYSLADIQALEGDHRNHHTSGETAVLYIVYVAGRYEGDSGGSRVLGVTYRGTSVAMFKANLQSASSSGPLSFAPPLTCVEQSVITHETGHAMGLVNLGAKMQRPHEDAANPGHSASRDSVMYYAVESSGSLASILQPFTGTPSCDQTGIPYRFDADDLADLKALG